jgi:DNA-directed RNA polymerase subunit RPC12/RpoP
LRYCTFTYPEAKKKIRRKIVKRLGRKRRMAMPDEKDQEIQELRKWVDDLQSGMYVNCVYCGYRYGPKESTPTSMADILKEHIERCPKHPLSKAVEDIRFLLSLVLTKKFPKGLNPTSYLTLTEDDEQKLLDRISEIRKRYGGEDEEVPIADPGHRVTKTGLTIKGLEESSRTQVQCPPDED